MQNIKKDIEGLIIELASITMLTVLLFVVSIVVMR